MRIWNLLAAAALPISLTGPAAAEDVGAFYKGRNVEVVISYGTGGGYDTYGRLIARHIGRHIEGTPTIVVKNMPGAGGLVGANYLYNVARRDGSVLGVVSQNAALGQALKSKGVKYDVRKFGWIGRMTSNVEIFYTWQTSKARSIQDTFAREVIAGGTGPTSSSVLMPKVLNTLLGTKFKSVSGYKGGKEVSLAMQRGEVDGGVSPWAQLKSANADWIRDKKINLIVQFALEKHADLPNIPTAIDLAKTSEHRQILSLLASGSAMGRALMAPPDVPNDRLAALRKCFDIAIADPQLLSEAKAVNLEIDPMSAAKLSEVAASVFSAPDNVLTKTAALTARPKKKPKK